MSKPISVARLKKNIINNIEAQKVLMRTLPYQIKHEMETLNNPKVIKGLQKRLDMVQNLSGDEGFDDNNSVVVAYEVYKMDQGFVWNNGWVRDEPRDSNKKLIHPDGSHVFPEII